MKKKILALLFVSAMGMFMLSGCKEKQNDDPAEESMEEDEQQSGIVLEAESTVTIDRQNDDTVDDE